MSRSREKDRESESDKEIGRAVQSEQTMNIETTLVQVKSLLDYFERQYDSLLTS